MFVVAAVVVAAEEVAEVRHNFLRDLLKILQIQPLRNRPRPRRLP
jgi:hypothetical protein